MGGKTKKRSKRLPANRCTGTVRETGLQCKLPAGHGTKHKGEGLCKFHGGNQVRTHGLYSIAGKSELGKQLEDWKECEEEALLSLVEEIRLAKAMISLILSKMENHEELMSDWREGGSKYGNPIEAIHDKLGSWLDRVTRSVEKGHQMKYGQKMTVSVENVERLLTVVEEILIEYTPEEKLADAIVKLKQSV